MSRNTYPVRVSRVVARDIRKSAEIPHPEVQSHVPTYSNLTLEKISIDIFVSKIDSWLLINVQCFF